MAFSADVTVEKNTARGVRRGDIVWVCVCMGGFAVELDLNHFPWDFHHNPWSSKASSSPSGSVHTVECTGLWILLSSQEDNDCVDAGMHACTHTMYFSPFTQWVLVTRVGVMDLEGRGEEKGRQTTGNFGAVKDLSLPVTIVLSYGERGRGGKRGPLRYEWWKMEERQASSLKIKTFVELERRMKRCAGDCTLNGLKAVQNVQIQWKKVTNYVKSVFNVKVIHKEIPVFIFIILRKIKFKLS